MEGVVHTVTIEDCKKISATAIDSVDAFSSAQIVLSYSGGRITVAGSGLKIVAFSKQSGAFWRKRDGDRHKIFGQGGKAHPKAVQINLCAYF